MSTAIPFLDRNSEARKILWALLAALFIHLLIAFSLAAFGGKLTSSAELENKPPELTIVERGSDTAAGYAEEFAVHGDRCLLRNQWKNRRRKHLSRMRTRSRLVSCLLPAKARCQHSKEDKTDLLPALKIRMLR